MRISSLLFWGINGFLLVGLSARANAEHMVEKNIDYYKFEVTSNWHTTVENARSDASGQLLSNLLLPLISADKSCHGNTRVLNWLKQQNRHECDLYNEEIEIKHRGYGSIHRVKLTGMISDSSINQIAESFESRIRSQQCFFWSALALSPLVSIGFFAALMKLDHFSYGDRRFMIYLSMFALLMAEFSAIVYLGWFY